MAHVVDLLKITEIEIYDFVSNYSSNEHIDNAWRPLREGVQLTRSFFLIMCAKPSQGFVKFAADFATGVKIRKHFGKLTAVTDYFSGRLSGFNLRFPIFHSSTQRGRTARG